MSQKKYVASSDEDFFESVRACFTNLMVRYQHELAEYFYVKCFDFKKQRWDSTFLMLTSTQNVLKRVWVLQFIPWSLQHLLSSDVLGTTYCKTVRRLL